MKWFINILLILAVLLMVGCGNNSIPNNPSTEKELLPGKIALTSTTASLAKMLVASTDSSGDSLSGDSNGVDIYLRTVKASEVVNMFLKNVGQSPILNLKMRTDNPAIRLSPGYIAVLETDENTSLAQILKMEIIHGTSIPGNQPIEPLLPYGETQFTVTFEGESAGLPFKAEYLFSVSAIYLDFQVVSAAGTSGILSEQAVLGTDSCNTWFENSRQLFPGDTAIVFDIISKDGGVYEHPIRTESLQSDCVIKQSLPASLQ